MLSSPQDFAAFQSAGTTRSHPLLTVRFLRTDLETTRFGLSTGRKLGGAVVRNRVRRRLREALRVMAPSFQPGWNVLIIARPAIVDADHDALVGALRRTLVRGGVLGGSQPRETDRDRASSSSTESSLRGSRRAAATNRRAPATPSRRSRSTACCVAAGWEPGGLRGVTHGTRAGMTRFASEASLA